MNKPVTFDDKSFLIGGQRIWLHAGDVHYFRHPAGSWEAALRRLRAAGLNTVSTYVAWNVHEPVEGEFDFTGDRDLGRYLDLAAELGLYVIVRPGPYICSEWDGGGLPAWLLGKPGIRTRDDDPEYVAAFRRWFDQVLPIIAPRQASRDGSVVLVQNENEYCGGWNESTRSYTRTINEIFREAGIDVPILACNCHGRPPDGMVINGTDRREDQMIWPDMVLTYNWGPGAECIRRLREVQPDKPLLMTEYWSGPQAFWGKPLADQGNTVEYGRSMLEFASLGCQVTYYMFDGGTNFGWLAGRNIVTSYQSKYPVREGGILGEKYYSLKPVNHALTQFGDALADSEEVVGDCDASVSTGSRLIARDTPQGRLLFVSDEGHRPSVELTVADTALTVTLPKLRSLLLPFRFEALPGLKLEQGNLGLLGRSAEHKTLVLWGVAGSAGSLRVNGKALSFTIRADQVDEQTVDDHRILVVGEKLAEHTWFLDDGRMVLGADFAELNEDGALSVKTGESTGSVFVVDERGLRLLERADPAPRPDLPRLRGWRKIDCPEWRGEGDDWAPLGAEPRSHEALECAYGYVWYKAEFEAEEDGFLPLFAPMRTTRLTAYANGLYCGTSGELTRFVEFCGYRHPADALAQDEVLVPVRRGRNTLVFLSDHLGRWFNGKPDIQGLCGPVYLGSTRLSFAGASQEAPAMVSDDAFPGLYEREFREPRPLPGMTRRLAVPEETDAYLRLPAGLKHVAVSVDGEHVISMPKSKYPFTAVRLPLDIAGREVAVALECEAEGGGAPCLEHIALYLAPRRDALQNWAWKPGGECVAPVEGDGKELEVSDQAEAWAGLMPDQKSPVGSGAEPAWYTVCFPLPEGDGPVFLEIGNMHKGQIYMNGHNLGRFWQVGGHNGGNGVQNRYYLPRPWMAEENRLVIFEEYGLPPEGVSLQYHLEET